MREAELAFIVLLAIMAAFYLIFIRPAQSEQRKRQKDVSELQPGDDVLTTGGFIAQVKDIETPEDGPVILHLELAPGVRVRALTSAVQQRIRPGRLEELTGRRKTAGAEPAGSEAARPAGRGKGAG